MGGNALKTFFNIEPRRLSTPEFRDLVQKAQTILSDSLSVYSKPTEFYAEKESHGDIDMVCATSFSHSKEQIQEKFKTDKVYANDNVYSVLFEGAQIDLIFVPHADFQANLDFRNYSPFGNTYSRMLKQLDVSWKVDGLYYVFRAGDSFKRNIFLTSKFETILKLGEFPSEIMYGDFQKEADIFNFVASSPFFRKEIYLLENLNHVNRKRDAVRPDYNRFNEYIATIPDKLLPEHVPTREENLEAIAAEFPFILPEIDNCYRSYIKQLENRHKFNGDMVSQITGLSGASLGAVIAEFKSSIELFDVFVSTSSKKEVELAFNDWYDSRT